MNLFSLSVGTVIVLHTNSDWFANVYLAVKAWAQMQLALPYSSVARGQLWGITNNGMCKINSVCGNWVRGFPTDISFIDSRQRNTSS